MHICINSEWVNNTRILMELKPKFWELVGMSRVTEAVNVGIRFKRRVVERRRNPNTKL